MYALIPALGRQKHEDPWGSLANQLSLSGKPQVSVRDPVSKNTEKGF